jgi:hypothetical protein
MHIQLFPARQLIVWLTNCGPPQNLLGPCSNIETLTQPSTGCPPTCTIQSSQLKAEPDHDIPLYIWVRDHMYTQFQLAQNSTCTGPAGMQLLRNREMSVFVFG